MENRVQPFRPLVEEWEVGTPVRLPRDGPRSRVAESGQHNQSSPSTRLWRKRGAQANAIGRSRGGLTTKVHLVVDALGLPLEFEITEGQRHDIVTAPSLVYRTKPRCLLADKAYDSDGFRQLLRETDCQAVIPPTASRVGRIAYDEYLYNARAEVECTFNLLKQARRFATRYEKTLRNYASVVAIGCALLWLRL